jgi:transcriptional regulator with XRE-family HTH domain
LRKEHNLSQEYIAERFGYKSYTTIQKWESGKTTPDMKTVKELAEMFGVSMENLANTDLSRGEEKVKTERRENFTEDEMNLISLYRAANKKGQEEIMNYAEYASERWNKMEEDELRRQVEEKLEDEAISAPSSLAD